MGKLINFIAKQIKNQEFVFLMLFIAVAVLRFPLQHHIALARFQHYGICLTIWASGFVLQALASWRILGPWGRATLLASASYVGIFAWIFYNSPWLDARMAVQTEEQDFLRLIYGIVCALFGLIVSIIWLRWSLTERHEQDKALQLQKQ